MQTATKTATDATNAATTVATKAPLSVEQLSPEQPKTKRGHDEITVFLRPGRGDKYYFRLRVDGKSITRCTGCTDKRAALKNASVAARAARSRDWTKLDETSIRPGWATVGDLLEIYREHAPDRSGEAAERRFLRYVSAACNTAAPKDASTREALDPSRFRSWIRTQEKSGHSSAGIHSDVQSIKSVVARSRAYIYADIKTPDLAEFRAVTGGSSKSDGYQPIARDTLRQMDNAARIPLRRQSLANWGIYWLMRRAGLRNSEVAALKWEWIEPHADGSADLVMIKRADWEPKGSSGRIPISARFHHLLRAAFAKGIAKPSGYVIPRKNVTEIKSLTERTINAFVRQYLPDREKGAYTLRMEFGSRIAARDGIEVAARLLRHADISTTFGHYHSLLQRPKPL